MANIGTDILGLPTTVGGLSGQEWVPIVQGGTTKRTQSLNMSLASFTELFPAGIDYEISGGGSTITPGVAGSGLVVPFDCTINQVVFTGKGTGSMVLDIWKCTQAQFDGGATHPVAGDSITGLARPTIVAGSIYGDTSLIGWTIALQSGDILWYNVVSVTNFQSVTLALKTVRALP